ncbi:hypothetical protein AM274_03265 [Pseudomonas nunensis]|nr:hypothetical protein AM274_03265 [Pseudomonas nunensis]
MLPVAAVEHREAAFGGEAVVKSDDAVCQVYCIFRVYDGFAAERSLAVLDSCYGGIYAAFTRASPAEPRVSAAAERVCVFGRLC